MHHFRGMMDCHRRLLSAAEALRKEIDGNEVTPRLLRLRYEMAIVARDNLTATQRLWSRIEREVPDIERHIRNYGRLKAVESDLHVPVRQSHSSMARRRHLLQLCGIRSHEEAIPRRSA